MSDTPNKSGESSSVSMSSITSSVDNSWLKWQIPFAHAMQSCLKARKKSRGRFGKIHRLTGLGTNESSGRADAILRVDLSCDLSSQTLTELLYSVTFTRDSEITNEFSPFLILARSDFSRKSPWKIYAENQLQKIQIQIKVTRRSEEKVAKFVAIVKKLFSNPIMY